MASPAPELRVRYDVKGGIVGGMILLLFGLAGFFLPRLADSFGLQPAEASEAWKVLVLRSVFMFFGLLGIGALITAISRFRTSVLRLDERGIWITPKAYLIGEVIAPKPACTVSQEVCLPWEEIASVEVEEVFSSPLPGKYRKIELATEEGKRRVVYLEKKSSQLLTIRPRFAHRLVEKLPLTEYRLQELLAKETLIGSWPWASLRG